MVCRCGSKDAAHTSSSEASARASSTLSATSLHCWILHLWTTFNHTVALGPRSLTHLSNNMFCIVTYYPDEPFVLRWYDDRTYSLQPGQKWRVWAIVRNHEAVVYAEKIGIREVMIM